MGRLLYTIQTNGPDEAIPGDTMTVGQFAGYGGPVNRLTQSGNLTATIVTISTASNGWSPVGTLTLSSAPASTSNTYYTINDVALPNFWPGLAGSLWGAVKYSVDAQGQETYYAYDADGRTLLSYTYKTWFDPNETSPVSGWVGTTTVYNSRGMVTDTYEETYIDAAPSNNLDGNFHILGTATGGPAGVQVDPSVYGQPASIIHLYHFDYNALGRKVDLINQYGGVTSYTYDGQGGLIRTLEPNGTETRSVYDALGRVIWTTTQPFVAVNSNLTSSANTAILTHTIYNQLGQLVETDQVQGGAIEVASALIGSGLVWTAQEVGGTIISSTKTFYDSAGNPIERVSTADTGVLRVGYIYNPDGTVNCSGPLSANAPDGGHVQTSNGTITAEFTATDFASFIQTRSNLHNATLGLFYTSTIDQNSYETDVYKNTSVSVNGHLEASYTYDDQGNRVSETVDGVTTLYLNDTMNPTGYAEPIEAKTSATGKPITTWITGDRVFEQVDGNGNAMYLLADGHCSTRLLTNAQGTFLAAFNYDAFGTAINFNAGMRSMTRPAGCLSTVMARGHGWGSFSSNGTSG